MSGGGVPANTSSTTTVNQSPWQNKTYRTLALGTPDNLGPVAQQLKIGQQLTQDWMDIQSGRNPGLYYGLQNATPERLAQETALRDVGFAGGRAPLPSAAPTATPAAPAEETQTAAQGGIMNLRGFATGGQPKPKPKPKPEVLAQPDADKNQYGFTAAQQRQWDSLEQLRNSGKKMTQQQIRSYNDLKGIRTTATANPAAQNKPTGAPFSYSDLATPTAFLDSKTGQNMLGDAQLAYQKARELGNPEQIQQATAAYNTAIQGLQGMANYAPQQVQASSVDRGGIRDVSAQQANVERMQGGPNVQAIQAQANQMAQPSDVTGQTYQAANIAPTRRERAATTAAPKTWTDPGVAQQYMNPYAQAVINQNVQEANRNFQKNLSALRGQAAKSKAYGGSRQGLEEAEALRNQGYLLADIQDKGLSQAYTQGMGQFQAEQGLGSQVGMSNTAQINQLKQQYMSMGLSEAQANQAAQNAASQFGAQSAQQAALANQQAGLTTGQANLSAAQQTALANQQAGMTAQQLNQLYGQGGFQTQAANQAAQNQAYNNYVAQMLAAQQGNQQVDYNTLLQNAQLAQQAATANQQAGLQANQQNLGAWGQIGNMAQGLGGLGATQNQIQLNNLGALGQSATAQTNYAQGALDRNTQNAMNWYNLPATFNAPGINALNAQQVNGGTNQSQQWYNQAKPFAKGGKVQWGPKK